MSSIAGTIKFFRGILYLGLMFSGILAVLGVGMFFAVSYDLPQVPDPIGRIIETPPTEIFAASGERVMLLGGREAVPIDRVSHYFINAVIATEDHRFWDHHGIDKLRTLKALWINLFQTGQRQGASTITQQLAKNLFFSFEQTYMRKFREMLVAIQIEARYKKPAILEAYVNQIPFGPREFGIEQAARTYFGIPAAELTLSQSALLAGLPKSPSRYNPYRHFDRAKKRQKVVLARMAAVGFITKAQAERAFKVVLQLRPHSVRTESGSYFIDRVIKHLEDKYGPEIVYHGGLKVTTTLDLRLQALAESAVQTGIEALEKKMGIEPDTGKSENTENRLHGALIAIETHSGAIKTVVGGRSYSLSEYNRAVQNNRQPGSGFKPFLYYTALEKLSMHPAMVVVDQPVTIKVVGAPDWKPQNFKRKHEGPMILKKALIHSINSIAAQLVEQTGPEAVIETAHRCGIKSRLNNVFSVALGSSGVSPLEMASGFATFATGGIAHEPFWIRRVEDFRGRVLEEQIISGKRRLDAGISYQLVDMMRGVMDHGTGAITRRLGFKLPAAGKTGTTNDYRDAWFTGFTPNLCTSVWVGFDQNTVMRDKNKVGITGGRGAGPIWTDFMMKATAGEPPREFSLPDDIRFETVNPVNGLIDPTSEKALRVALRRGQMIEQIPETVIDSGDIDLDPKLFDIFGGTEE